MFAAPGDRVKAASHFGSLIGEKLIINLMFAPTIWRQQRVLCCESHKLIKLILLKKQKKKKQTQIRKQVTSDETTFKKIFFQCTQCAYND